MVWRPDKLPPAHGRNQQAWMPRSWGAPGLWGHGKSGRHPTLSYWRRSRVANRILSGLCRRSLQRLWRAGSFQPGKNGGPPGLDSFWAGSIHTEASAKGSYRACSSWSTGFGADHDQPPREAAPVGIGARGVNSRIRCTAVQFVKAKKLKLATARHLDRQASEYLNMMFLEGEALSAGGHLLSAIKRFMPEYRLHLPISSQFHRNWQRQHKPVRAYPASIKPGGGFRSNLFHSARAWVGSFGCPFLPLLSTNCWLQWNHLLTQSDRRTINVVLPFSKTSEGNPQVLRLENQCLWKVVQKLRPPHQPQQLLWPHSVQAFHRVWKRLLPCLGLMLLLTPLMAWGVVAPPTIFSR